MPLRDTEPALVYLDNAATSYPKPEEVYQSQDNISRNWCANPGRGGHKLSQKSAQIVLKARLAIADLFSIADCSQVVFTSNATEAINIALMGALESGDRVVTTTMEHNSVTRPLYELQRRGVDVVKVQCDAVGRLNLDDLKHACLAASTKMVIINHCSNVTGTLQPAAEIGSWCREQGIIFMLDAAQSAGVLPVDVQQMSIDILTAPGHKSLLGPQGTGILYLDKEINIRPLKFGGTGTMSTSVQHPNSMPEHLECGTMNTPALAALTAGIEWINKKGMETICRHEQRLVDHLRSGLKQLPDITLYGPDTAEGGVLSFTVANTDPSEIGFFLDRHYNIAVRVGLHCAPDAHNTIGSFPQGTIRVSPGIFNTIANIDALIQAITEITASRRSCV